MQILTMEDAVAWVDQNAKMIHGHTRKYLPFAPYDQEDFLQDAYEAALVAAKVSAERQIPFPACFWITFKGKISEVTPNPNSRRHAGSSSPPSTQCSSFEFFDWGFNPSGSLFNIDIDRLYLIIRKHLTPAEDKILGLALGIREGRKAIREIARDLGCSPANVRQALNRTYRRLSNLVESGQLPIDLKDVEPRHLTTIFGTAIKHINTHQEAAEAA
jgi:hypothetical protein